MQSLELKIPPPIIALAVAAAMWGISVVSPSLETSLRIRGVAAGVLALGGVAIALSGGIAFRRARTTVNPMKPQATSALVTGGIYRFTRNPMYVGILFVLAASAALLSSAWALIGPAAFALYIARFQIAPEERVLAAMFGTAYSEYKAKVRRWL